RQRVPDQFEDAIKLGKQTEWYDDALFYYADWMNSYGTIRQSEDGTWQQEPDYVKALGVLQRLTREYSKGETRYYDQAVQLIKQLTDPTIGVVVSNIFLPNSELQFALNTRNVNRIDLALYKIDLTKDVRFNRYSDADEGDADDGRWLQQLSRAVLPAVKAWRKELNDKNDHKPY